jgi:hypothetical protein
MTIFANKELIKANIGGYPDSEIRINYIINAHPYVNV